MVECMFLIKARRSTVQDAASMLEGPSTNRKRCFKSQPPYIEWFSWTGNPTILVFGPLAYGGSFVGMLRRVGMLKRGTQRLAQPLSPSHIKEGLRRLPSMSISDVDLMCIRVRIRHLKRPQDISFRPSCGKTATIFHTLSSGPIAGTIIRKKLSLNPKP